MNLPRWRYVADGELPDGYEECLVEDAFGHRFVAEFYDSLIIDYDEDKDCVREVAHNVFTSKLGHSPNEVVRWVPMKDIVIITEVKKEKRKMKIEDAEYIKARTIEWLRRSIKTFDERTTGFMTEQSRIDRGKFSALLEEFVDILEEDSEEL